MQISSSIVHEEDDWLEGKVRTVLGVHRIKYLCVCVYTYIYIDIKVSIDLVGHKSQTENCRRKSRIYRAARSRFGFR